MAPNAYKMVGANICWSTQTASVAKNNHQRTPTYASVTKMFVSVHAKAKDNISKIEIII